jgi:hypothetical protein
VPDLVGGQLAELAAANDGQDRLEDILVLLDGLGCPALQPGGQPGRARVGTDSGDNGQA